jgi:hypothetical protein
MVLAKISGLLDLALVFHIQPLYLKMLLTNFRAIYFIDGRNGRDNILDARYIVRYMLTSKECRQLVKVLRAWSQNTDVHALRPETLRRTARNGRTCWRPNRFRNSLSIACLHQCRLKN